MSAVTSPDRVDPTARRGSLARAEARRYTSRPLVRLLHVLAVLGLLAGALVASTQFERTTPEALAGAERNRSAVVAEQEAFRQECLAAVGTPDGPPSAEACGEPLTDDQLGDVEQFLDRQPFRLETDGRGGLYGVAGLTAVLAFLLGATSVGAEWASRSMVALLFWEPRRLRVMATKLGVLALALAGLAVLLQGLWLLVARVLTSARGEGRVPDGVMAELLAVAGRGTLLAVLVGLLGFGVANLLRNTGAALGVGFAYFALAENLLRVLRGSLQPWLLTENAAALLTTGGTRLFLPGPVDARGMQASREVVLSNLHGGLWLGAVTAAVVAVGVVLFTRRDLD